MSYFQSQGQMPYARRINLSTLLEYAVSQIKKANQCNPELADPWQIKWPVFVLHELSRACELL
jgi:hypothetical protein